MYDEHCLGVRGRISARPIKDEERRAPRARALQVAGAAMLVAIAWAPATASAQQVAVMTPDVAAASCSACHGLDGKSSGAIPSIDKIDAATMTAKLKGFKNGELASTIMNRIAKGFSDAEIDSLVKFMAAK